MIPCLTAKLRATRLEAERDNDIGLIKQLTETLAQARSVSREKTHVIIEMLSVLKSTCSYHPMAADLMTMCNRIEREAATLES